MKTLFNKLSFKSFLFIAMMATLFYAIATQESQPVFAGILICTSSLILVALFWQRFADNIVNAYTNIYNKVF